MKKTCGFVRQIHTAPCRPVALVWRIPGWRGGKNIRTHPLPCTTPHISVLPSKVSLSQLTVELGLWKWKEEKNGSIGKEGCCEWNGSGSIDSKISFRHVGFLSERFQLLVITVSLHLFIFLLRITTSLFYLFYNIYISGFWGFLFLTEKEPFESCIYNTSQKKYIDIRQFCKHLL